MSLQIQQVVARSGETICSGVYGPDPSLKRPSRLFLRLPHFLGSPEQIPVTALPLQAKSLRLLWLLKSAFLVAAQRRTWNDAAKF
jgi:hypothetical protein